MRARTPVPTSLALLAVLATTGRPSPGVQARAADAPVASPAAPRPAVADLAEALRGPRETHGVPGLAAAVLRGGGVTAAGVDGVRRRGADARVAPGDRWHLGSCTKAMTATLCGLLAEANVLRFDTTLPEGLPDLAARMDAGWKRATLERLLEHRGGAPANLDADGLWGRLWAFPGTPRDARRALAEGVLARAPTSPPGTAFLYSNAGYALAGAVAEARAGAPWEDLLRERLFAPLGITTAGFGAPGRPEALDQPRGHREDGTPVEPGPGADNPPAIAPAGTVHMAIEDWAKFVALHLQAARGAPRLLTASTFARLHAPPEGGEYALGWSRPERAWAGGRVLTHAGSNTMWYAVAWLAPERDLAVLVCANQGGARAARAADEVASALIARFAAPAGR